MTGGERSITRPRFSYPMPAPYTFPLLAAAVLILVGCDPRAADQGELPLHRFKIVAGARGPEQKISPALRSILTNVGGDEKVRVVVDLTEQLDLDRVGTLLASRALTRKDRRTLVVTALRELADAEQRRLSPLLSRLRSSGEIGAVRNFSVVNRIVVEANTSAINSLAARPEVALIDSETEEEISDEAGWPSTQARSTVRQSWAIGAIGADSLWKLGLDGSGTVVGIIDPGVSAAHEQLRDNFRGGATSWLDPDGARPSPVDEAPGHGTSVLSTAVGANVNGILLGVAPRAKWVACGAFIGGRYNNIRLTECAEWMMSKAQPDVLVLPWLLPGGPGCDTSLHRIVSAWRAAEIFPVFAAGNQGPGPASNRSPANYVRLYPGNGVSLAVGGVTQRGETFAASSRGANQCDSTVTFPRIVAPAFDIPAAIPITRSAYVESRGTSIAAGLVAGGVALLRQRYPDATVLEIETALLRSARDAGEPGPDRTFGYGRLDLPSALDTLSGMSDKKETRQVVRAVSR